MSVGPSVCLSVPKRMRRRYYVAQTRACSKSDLSGYYRHKTFRLYAIAALVRTKKKRSLWNGKLKANRASETDKQRKERLR